MPQAPKHPCPGKGPRRGMCPNLIGRGERCCAECEPHARADVRRYDRARDQGEGRQVLHSRHWRAIREAKLARDPLCEPCLSKDRDTAAFLVHHKDRDETNNSNDNLVSMCFACHEEEHKAERFGRK